MKRYLVFWNWTEPDYESDGRSTYSVKYTQTVVESLSDPKDDDADDFVGVLKTHIVESQASFIGLGEDDVNITGVLPLF
jgi:hypothetical protein